MQELQASALQAMIRRIYNHVPFYRNRLMALGIEPGDLRSVEQLKLLPSPPRRTCATTTPSTFHPATKRGGAHSRLSGLPASPPWWATVVPTLSYGRR